MVGAGAAVFVAGAGAGVGVGTGVGAGAGAVVTGAARCAEVRDAPEPRAERPAGALGVPEGEPTGCVFAGVPATPTAGRTTGFGCALETARTGCLTTATTSPATSFSAGATPAERTGAVPVGSRSSESEIDAATSAAGNALVMGTVTFIVSTPAAATTRRVRFV